MKMSWVVYWNGEHYELYNADKAVDISYRERENVEIGGKIHNLYPAVPKSLRKQENKYKSEIEVLERILEEEDVYRWLQGYNAADFAVSLIVYGRAPPQAGILMSCLEHIITPVRFRWKRDKERRKIEEFFREKW